MKTEISVYTPSLIGVKNKNKFVENCVSEYVETYGWNVSLNETSKDRLERKKRIIFSREWFNALNDNMNAEMIPFFVFHCCSVMGKKTEEVLHQEETEKPLQREKEKPNKEADLEEMLYLFSDGWSVKEISEHFGCGIGKVYEFFTPYRSKDTVKEADIIAHLEQENPRFDKNIETFNQWATRCIACGEYLRSRKIALSNKRFWTILWNYSKGMRVVKIAKKAECTRAYVYMVINKYTKDSVEAGGSESLQEEDYEKINSLRITIFEELATIGNNIVKERNEEKRMKWLDKN